MANKRIQTTELDFDQIKANLKTFLQGQSEFSDYDFEGSGLSVLLDILAYNTHYNALYTNLAINEAFIDSASKRASVVSKAKELGYLPHSAHAAEAIVTVLMINDQVSAPATQTLAAYTPFNVEVDGVSYTFYNTANQTASKVGNQYIFSNVTLREGRPLSYSYVWDGNSPIVIPNAGVDMNTIRVTVQENAGTSAAVVYSQSDSIINVTPTSRVFFLRELEDQTYQLEFGNDLIGKALEVGNIVTIDYFITAAEAANGARAFTFAGTPPANTIVYVTTTSAAAGGHPAEDIDQIRFNAPRAYTAQNRCVTAEDYRTTILSLYPLAKAVSVWGGERNNPPVYGKVFLSIVPETLDILSNSEKDYILDSILGPRKALTITPVIVDPTYIRIELNVTFYYNPQLTTKAPSDLVDIVRQTINDYNDITLTEFAGMFKYSKLVGAIDQSENSITSNITTLKLHREVTPVFNVANQYIVDLGNPIYNSGVPEESVITNGFMTTDSSNISYIEDVPGVEGSGVGTLRLFYISSSGEKVEIKTCGTVNYNTGLLTINDLTITSLQEGVLDFIIKPQSNDVLATKDQFLTIDATRLSINYVVDSQNGSYAFTSSRN